MAFSFILQLETLHKIIINTLLVSIPEEFYWIMFTYILMGEFDHWKTKECKRLFQKDDYYRVFIPVAITATVSNIFRYYGFDSAFVSIATFFLLFLCIILMGDITNNATALKWIRKALIYLLLGAITIMIAEYSYIPILLYATEMDMTEVNKNIWVNFLFSLPSKAFEYLFLIFLVARKRMFIKASVMKPILENKSLLMATMFVSSFNIIYMIVLAKVICYDKVLINTSFWLQTFIIICTFLFPFINMFSILFAIYYKENIMLNKENEIHGKLDDLLNEIKTFTNNNNDNIKWKLNEIGLGIEQIAVNLNNDTIKGGKRYEKL